MTISAPYPFAPYFQPTWRSAPPPAASEGKAAEQEPAEPKGEATGAADSPSDPLRTGANVSQAVQAFLLQLQELGFSSTVGSEGNDQLGGWSSSRIEAGSGNDTVSVWSNSFVEAGDGDDMVRAWSESQVTGGNGDDFIDVWSNSLVDGGSGNDRISAWSGSKVDGGDGDDVIDGWSETVVNGGAGNDIISVHSNSRVDGGAGDDTIWVGAGGVATGGEGNDTISALNGGDVSGGAGNDTITLHRGARLLFERGDGQDTVSLDLNSEIELGAGINPEDIGIEQTERATIITFKDSDDRLTLERVGRSAAIVFANGSRVELQPHPLPRGGEATALPAPAGAPAA